MLQEKDFTNKQYLFCLEYLVDFNATKAAIKAGYSKKTAYVQGCRLLTVVKIKEFIKQQAQVRLDDLDISIDTVIKEIATVAFHKEDTEALTKSEIKIADKLKALDMIAKHIGLYEVKSEASTQDVSEIKIVDA